MPFPGGQILNLSPLTDIHFHQLIKHVDESEALYQSCPAMLNCIGVYIGKMSAR
jgi:hypothetical protein